MLETGNGQGQVVQSAHCPFINCSMEDYINYIGIFAEKMSVTYRYMYALQKLLTSFFFSKKFSGSAVSVARVIKRGSCLHLD